MTPEHKAFVTLIKSRIRLSQLVALFEDWAKNYAPQLQLSEDQFDDVFSPLLNNTAVFFDIVSDHGRADYYTGMVCLVIFSQGDIEEKVSFLFQMFNADGSDDMDRKEMGKFFLSSIIGLCKICKLPPPSKFGLQDFVTEAFNEVD